MKRSGRSQDRSETQEMLRKDQVPRVTRPFRMGMSKGGRSARTLTFRPRIFHALHGFDDEIGDAGRDFDQSEAVGQVDGPDLVAVDARLIGDRSHKVTGRDASVASDAEVELCHALACRGGAGPFPVIRRVPAGPGALAFTFESLRGIIVLALEIRFVVRSNRLTKQRKSRDGDIGRREFLREFLDDFTQVVRRFRIGQSFADALPRLVDP